MKTHLYGVAALALLGACKDDPSQAKYSDRPVDTGGDDGGDGGGDGGGGDGGGACTATVLELEPESGDTNVSVRAPIEVLFSEDARTLSPTFTLADSAGGGVSVGFAFDETGSRATITPNSPLVADASYTFTVNVCDTQSQTTFTTSLYGAPLEISDAELEGRTYYFDLSTAYYEEPPGLGAVLATFLQDPLLVGIGAVEGGNIQLIGTQGTFNGSGDIVLADRFPVWDFGNADFSGSPYFESEPTRISIDYDGIDIPIHDFALYGTFAPDGSSIGFAGASGLGDSRNMGPLLGMGSDPDAVCDTAATLGVDCDACPDGGVYCLMIVLEFQPSPLVPGISLSL